MAHAQIFTVRAPAVPLFTISPYVSWWLPCDLPTECFPEHAQGDKWAGMTALVRIDEENFRLLGPECTADVPPLQHVGTYSLLSMTRTIFSFAGRGVQLNMTFALPWFIDSPDTFQPYTYVIFDAVSTDNKIHKVREGSERWKTSQEVYAK